mgnify:CR=1 FL=1
MSRPAAAVHAVIKAYDVRGLVGEQIDEEFVAEVGGAFARLMRAEGATTVAIGYDMRSSSPSLAAAFAAGVTAQGLDVVRIGLASTDQLYFASGLLDCPGAMFTASHNPAAYNGIKLCRAGAKPVGRDTGLNTISDEVIAGVPSYDGTPGTAADRDVLAEYGTFLRSLVDVSALRPLRVAVDAGNGMGGHTTPAVLGAVSSITLQPLYFELDGTFPNHEANPLDPANLVDLQKHVLDGSADISSEDSEKIKRGEKLLLEKFPEVDYVFCRLGTSEVATDPMPPNETDFYIFYTPVSEWPKGPGLPTNKAELCAAIEKEALSAHDGQSIDFILFGRVHAMAAAAFTERGERLRDALMREAILLHTLIHDAATMQRELKTVRGAVGAAIAVASKLISGSAASPTLRTVATSVYHTAKLGVVALESSSAVKVASKSLRKLVKKA